MRTGFEIFPIKQQVGLLLRDRTAPARIPAIISVFFDAGTNVQRLSQLRAAGRQVFMDDFGTGYSGLSQIARLPIDALKIDRAFIAEMTTSSEHMAIVSTIINLAKALRMFVVAEGVETEE